MIAPLLAGVWELRAVGLVPPRPERVGDRTVLGGRQPPPELALDDLPVSGACRGMTVPAFGSEHHPHTATVVGYRLAPDKAGGLDPIHQPSQPAAREQGPLLQSLHAGAGWPRVGEPREHIEPRQREAVVLQHVDVGDLQDPGAREQDAAP